VSGRIADPVRAATEAGALRGAIQDELRRAQRFRQECAVLDMALDGGDELARRAGPVAVHRALSSLALLVNNEIRDVDWTARTAEGDLVVFLAGTGRLGAVLAAGRLVAKAAGLDWPGEQGGPRVSVGVAAFPEDARFGKDLLAAARRALYRARSRGGGVCDRAEVPGRSFVRVAPGSVRTVIRALADGETPAPAAGNGILFFSSVPYDIGAGLELDCIEVAGRGRARVRGRVVRLEERPGGDGFEIGLACDLEPEAAHLLEHPARSREGAR
jgi:diguanylate cyclase (GGDEF)-like protein